MTRILINAVSAKHGGAKTIVESLVTAAAELPQHAFIVLAGFEFSGSLPNNVTWHYSPKSGVAAMAFSLVGVTLPFLRYRADILISFNNINTPLLSTRRRLTYFHQLKALDFTFSELKIKAIRMYLRYSREPIIVQSNEVKNAFQRMFGYNKRKILVSWPGIIHPKQNCGNVREARRVLVPISTPQSAHKNFIFIENVAQLLGSDWIFIVTAPSGAVTLRPGTPNIKFIGMLPRQELFNQYRRATICLVSSTHETIGLPIFESLAVGTPVVAYNAPYIRSFRNYFGISEGLFLAKNPKEAASEIVAISHNPFPHIEVEKNFQKADWDCVFSQI